MKALLLYWDPEQLAARARGAEKGGPARSHRTVAAVSRFHRNRDGACDGAARTTAHDEPSIDRSLVSAQGSGRARTASRIGTMNFGKRTDEPLAKRIIARADERGLDFLDTANMYNDGESERIVGRAINGRREKFVVAYQGGLRPRERQGRRSLASAPARRLR